MTETASPMQRGGSPDLVADEYMWVVSQAIRNAPRTQQALIGPSEIGQPCARRIGYRLLHTPGRDLPPNWKATVGTGTHLWLEQAFSADNDRWRDDMPEGRWMIEIRVPVGEVNGQSITGTCDLYDRVSATVIDHKTCGPSRLDHYRRHGPGQQYRAQAHLYGRGWERLGVPVDTVMIVFLPRNGALSDAYVWHERYDERVATEALDRLGGIATALDMIGAAALAHLPTAEAFCLHCPYFKINSTDLSRGCPGDPSLRAPAPALSINS